MAFDYSLIKTETHPYGERKFFGYNTSNGLLLNPRIFPKLSISPSVKTHDREIYIPGDTVAGFAGLTWTTLKTERFNYGIERIERAYATVGGNVLLNTITTIEQSIGGSILIALADDQYQVIEGAYLSGTDIVTSARDTPWFEWNGLNTSQFDSPVLGSQITGGSINVVSIAGANWIQILATSSITPLNEARTTVALPITKTPPNGNYRIEADFISIAKFGTLVGAAVFARFGGTASAYWSRFTDAAASQPQLLGKYVGGENSTVLGVAQGDTTSLPTNGGMRIGVGVEASSILRASMGQKQNYADTSGPITSTGKAAIGCAIGNAASATVINAFRNIRCYSL